MTHAPQFKNAALLIALAAAYPLQAHALAGVAQFTAGEVNVRQTDGRALALAKGGNIESGHAIITGGNGRAQVKFTDGGLISLQPNTEFKIANYVDQNDPKQDRFLVDLLRGSMRAITGLIGKRNRDNYKLTTTTATIGIRGSGFKVGYNPDGSLGITSELDKIEVCNQSGCIGLVAGESVRVIDSTTPPVRTSQQAKVETPSTEQDPIVVGNKVNEEGKAAVVTAVALKEQTFTDITVLAVATDSSSNAFNELGAGGGLSSTFEVNGAKMVKVNKPGAISTTWTPTGSVVSVGFMGNVGDADFLGWGSWVQTSKEVVNGGTTTVTPLQYFHYIAGRPTSAMPTTGTATYIFAGGTAPTRINGGGTTVGTINAANTNLSVNFGTSSLTANIDTSLTVISDTASISGASFSGTYINGFFAGAGAARAGLTFKKDLTAGDVVTGAVVFTKQ